MKYFLFILFSISVFAQNGKIGNAKIGISGYNTGGSVFNGSFWNECFTTNEVPLYQNNVWNTNAPITYGALFSGINCLLTSVGVTNWGNLGQSYYAFGLNRGTNGAPPYGDSITIFNGLWGPTQHIQFKTWLTNRTDGEGKFWEWEYFLMATDTVTNGITGYGFDLSVTNNNGGLGSYVEGGINYISNGIPYNIGLGANKYNLTIGAINGSTLDMYLTNTQLSVYLDGVLCFLTNDVILTNIPHGGPGIGFFQQGYAGPAGLINTNFGMLCVKAEDYNSVWRSIFNGNPIATANGNNSEIITWNTTNVLFRPETNSTSCVDWGITAGVYTNSVCSNNITSSPQINLSNLVAGTTYHYQARSQNLTSGLWVTNADATFTPGGGGTCTVLFAQDTQSGSATAGNDSQQVTFGSSVTVCKQRFYCDGSATAKVQIWDSPNATGTQFGTDSGTVTITASTGFYDFTWSSNPSLPAGTYYMTLITITGSINIYHNFVGSGGKAYQGPNPNTAWDLTYETWTLQ